nr:hypothetical protein [Tanacetum cinerariifolium]
MFEVMVDGGGGLRW